MQLVKEVLKYVKYRNWDEAFRALTPAMRQQSVRVADYTQVLFEGVCKSTYYLKDQEAPVYIDEAYAEIAYKCGFYHQIGKAMEPESYLNWDENMSLDEKNHYCRYTVEGKELVARLQGENGDKVSVSNKMIQDACEYHMEHWDGKGFPYGYEKNEISLIGQIVGLAKELDRLVCERKSETPFEEAVELILQGDETRFSSELIEVFMDRQIELKNVYKKYIQYTKTMPKTVPLVERRQDRPFGLTYRQIVSGKSVETFILEATPWFGGVLDQPDVRESAEEVEVLLMRTGMTKDIVVYFLYEAADAIVRMKNCELRSGGILLPVFSAFYTSGDHSEALEKLYTDTGIDKKKLMMTIQESLVLKEQGIYELLASYIGQGVEMVLDNYHPEDVPVQLLQEIGFTKVRIAKDSEGWKDIKQTIHDLKTHGIMAVDWPSGEIKLTEDELIRYLMNQE